MRRIDTLVIHHSAGPSGTVAEFRAEHIARLGATDIGYHEVIGNGHGLPDGHIAEGRPHDMVGAGVWGNNSGKLHVCCVGNFERPDKGYTGRPSDKQLFALGHWLHTNARRYGISSPGRVVGHREIALKGHETACPGTDMPLHTIRLWFAANVADATPEPLSEYLHRTGALG